MKRGMLKVFALLLSTFHVIPIFGRLLVLQGIADWYNAKKLVCESEDDGSGLIWNGNLNWYYSSYEFSDRAGNMEFISTYPQKRSDVINCNMNDNESCMNEWNIHKWSLTDSLTNPMGPVLDQRWEEFQEHNNFHKYDEYKRTVTLNQTGTLVFSVRGTKDAHIVLCDGEDYETSFCYWVIIGGWNNTESAIRKCANGIPVPTSYPHKNSECRKKKDSHVHEALSPTEWRTFVLRVNYEDRTVYVSDSDNVLLRFVDKGVKSKPGNGYRVFIRSLSPMLLRFHIYKFLYTNESDAILSSSVTFPYTENLCVQMLVGLCAKCQLDVTWSLSSGETTVETIEGSMAVYDLPKWKWIEIKKEVRQSGRLDITIAPRANKDVENPFWAVAKIRECPAAGTVRHGMMTAKQDYKKGYFWPVVKCQKLSYTNNTTTDATAAVTTNTGIEISECPAGFVGLDCSVNCAKELNADLQCTGVIFCESNKCTCPPGYRDGNCKQRCHYGFYGQNCASACGSCARRDCNFVTGVCTYGCSETYKYIPPFCKTEIKLPSPDIDFVNETSLRVSLPVEDEYKESTANYEFQLQVQYVREWRTSGRHQIDKNASKIESTFDQLEPGTTYWVNCVLRVGIDTSYPSEITGNVAEFTTTCTPTNKFLTEAEERSVVLKRAQETWEPQWCPDSWYSIYMETADTGSRLLQGPLLRLPYKIIRLSPYTLYKITVFRGNVTYFSKEVQTLEAPPSQVTNIQWVLKNRSIALKWDHPEEENGKIQRYEVSLKIETYLGCQDQQISSPKKNDEKSLSTTSTEATFVDLHPYATYLVTIVAWNSKRGREEKFRFPTEANDIPTAKFSNLRLENFRLMWDMPEDCTTISGPIAATKIIIQGISEAVKEYHEERQTTSIYFELGSRSQEVYGAEIYVAEVYPLRGFDQRYNKSTSERLQFTTPPKAPPAVRDFEIYEVDSRIGQTSLRWQEPLPPTNGKIKQYSIEFCDNWCQSNTQIISTGKPCLLWKNYICASVTQPSRNFKWIEIRAHNVNVSTPGKEARVKDKRGELVPDAPLNLTAVPIDKGVLNVSWSHPWQPGGPLRKFSIEITVVSTDLREQISKAKISYDYVLDLYEPRYSKLFYLFPSTTYNVTVRAVTSRNLGRPAIGKWRTPSAMDFAEKLEFESKEGSSTVLLHIPKLLNDTRDNELHVIVKGPQACDRYSPVSPDLSQLAEVKYYEVAWRAATVPTNKYAGNVFTVGDNKIYGGATNCPLKPEESYAIVVIVQTKVGSMDSQIIIARTASIHTSGDTGKHHEIWLVPVVIFFVIVAVLFFLYRRRNKELSVKEKMMQDEMSLSYNVETCDGKNVPLNVASKHASSSTVNLFDKDSTSRKSTPEVPLMALESDLDGKRSSLVKVKDFEDYVRQGIESGLLDKQYETFPRGQTKPWDYGKLPQNKSKNRYGNLVAYDETRVVLKKLPDDPYSDYINANYIKGYKNEKCYIATQGPKPNTVIDFWRMIWQEEVFIICMLANVVESGKTKCEQYWPDIGKKKRYGDVVVLNAKHNVFADYTFRTLHVSYGDEIRKIEHFHYTAWPDHSIPLYTHSVVTYLKKLLATPTRGKPVVVHCSAGIGRTGTIILCDICLRRAAAEGVVDVYAETESIRDQRANMVDNKQQYLLAHLALVECLLSFPTALPCNDTLPANIKELKKQLAVQQQRLQDTAWQDEALRPCVSQTSLSERNLAKNRFPELVSKRVSRVYLKRYPASDEDSDYISAVYVDGVRLQNQYLATQLPLPSTVNDFWRMVAEFKVELIVMLQPPDLKDPTCCNVAPKTGEFKPTPYINVTCKDFMEIEYYTSQKFVLVDNSEKPSREQPVTILCSTEWKPGRNQEPPPVMTLVTLWQAAERISRGDGPTVVLCHDGVTGCGLYLALSFLLERMAVERECDVCLAIRAIRRSRPDFVQSLEHMEYLYDAALTYLEYFETYANFS